MRSRRITALRSIVTIIPAACCALAVFSCAHTDNAQQGPDRPAATREPAQPSEIFPHIRLVDGALEIDGIVPIDCHHPDTPHVFLEVVACAPDTREHESLAMTRARASHIHAALLLLDLEAGAPGAWTWDRPGRKPSYVAPTGDKVDVFLRVERPDGSIDERPVREWIVDRDTGAMLPDEPFTFAGSRFVQFRGVEVYDADFAGNLVGLATFGNEVVAWSEVFSPDSQVDEPRWIANRDVVPVFGTPVTIILRPAR